MSQRRGHHHGGSVLGARSHLVVVCAVLGACADKGVEVPVFRFTALSTADGDPLAGVEVLVDASPVGKTASNGELGFTLRKPEGSTIRLSATCPSGYRPCEDLAPVRLRSMAFASPEVAARGMEVPVICRPSKRIAAVVVRAKGIANLPLLLRGNEIARTDADGVAHLLLSLAPTETFRLQFDTTEFPRLQPRSPTATFTLADADQIFVYDQPFEEQERHHRAGRRPTQGPLSPPRPIPIMIR